MSCVGGFGSEPLIVPALRAKYVAIPAAMPRPIAPPIRPAQPSLLVGLSPLTSAAQTAEMAAPSPATTAFLMRAMVPPRWDCPRFRPLYAAGRPMLRVRPDDG